MFVFSFLCGIAVTLAVETVVLLIATAWMKRRIRKGMDR